MSLCPPHPSHPFLGNLSCVVRKPSAVFSCVMVRPFSLGDVGVGHWVLLRGCSWLLTVCGTWASDQVDCAVQVSARGGVRSTGFLHLPTNFALHDTISPPSLLPFLPAPSFPSFPPSSLASNVVFLKNSCVSMPRKGCRKDPCLLRCHRSELSTVSKRKPECCYPAGCGSSVGPHCRFATSVQGAVFGGRVWSRKQWLELLGG